MIIYEISYVDQFEQKKQRHISISLFVSTCNSIALAIALIIRNFVEYKWIKTKKYITEGETIISSGYLKAMIIEALNAMQAPHIWFNDITYREYNYDYDVYYTYPLNHLMSCLVWSKFYIPVRTRFLTNKYTAPRAQRVW